MSHCGCGGEVRWDLDAARQLRDFRLRCARRGVKFRLTYPDDPPEVFAERTTLYKQWCAQREAFSREYGWHGGREVRRSEETSYGLFDPYALRASTRQVAGGPLSRSAVHIVSPLDVERRMRTQPITSIPAYLRRRIG